MTENEYDAKYKKPIRNFALLKIEREQKKFLLRKETWLVVAGIAVIVLVLLLAASVYGLSAAWGAVGLVVQIIYGLSLAAGIMLICIHGRSIHRRRWSYVFSLVLCAALSIAMFMYVSLPAVRDIGAKPVTGTFRVVDFTYRRRSLSSDMTAVEINTGRIEKFPVSEFSRDGKRLREELKIAEPVVVITYYPHSKVRTHLEY
ncbi:MAG: hypothetical protein FWE98_00280 [Oscillospiraceae bacterium]|nr:hypothetical protein [Oscillospiraceae bacterium]